MNRIYSCHFTRSEAIWWWYWVSDSQLVSVIFLAFSWSLAGYFNESQYVSLIQEFIIMHLFLIREENSLSEVAQGILTHIS